ncbi:rho guanine nucleotide exchange factor 2 [Cephus cinctus]|uniref:Rho guanine nucleotide exchange factor 2 n=1 Tax=Cephus cinctus TaxID=211228 RepID=A0AAJ7RFQ8_CEPCN|nr:rho guanine nucleotide exchange factor 2 [Cephus cinctus]
MEKRHEGLAPFSSDECPNSGEDSDEDVITDYLGSTHSDCSRVPIGTDLTGLDPHHTDNLIDSGYTKDTTNIMSESVDEQHHRRRQQHPQELDSVVQSQPVPFVPIISVTPHSPGLAKPYLILEDTVQHFHELYDSVQRMRDITLSTLPNNKRAEQRLISSCPSLRHLIANEAGTRSSDQDGGSDPDLLANCSTNSSPSHFPSVGHPQTIQGIDRRRSWTDLEDSRLGRRSSAQNHLQAQNMRQRSISLSSLDSEMDLELDGKSRTGSSSVGNRACRSQSSTHSLNEADLVQNPFNQGDFKKIAIKRGGQRLGEAVGLMPGVIGARLPLQKSISTPSIVTPPGHATHAESAIRAAPSLTASRHERNEKGSGSETETEDLHTAHGHDYHEDLTREGTPNVQTSLDELLNDGVVYDDHHSEKTRRKRGSLFFRKKKDKSGKKVSQLQTHQWITITGNPGSYVCDFCMKHLVNKPVLHCENCGVTAHQIQNCKDQLSLECTKSKHHSNKASSKSMSSVSSISVSVNMKRGSTSSLPLPSSTGSGREINSKKAVTSYSPWRRVATKLGVNQTINEEKDGDANQHRDISGGWEEFDFGDESHQFTIVDLEGLDPELGLGREEPDSWSAAIGRNIALRLVDNCEREVKRQEHIYEFVLTEKHHCLVLLAMDRIFVEGLRKHFRLGPPDLERMFPRLRDLTNIHLRFLLKLRRRQSASAVVPSISDILVDQFSGENSLRMKSAYGEFCSRHRDAVDAYKYYLRHDPRFARFVSHCQTNPLLKKKGIPECILFVTQRLTKYPLLVEPLIKTGLSTEEGESLRKALALVKEILGDVDACVANKEREDRKLEIYNRIDAKSFATYRDAKFKKSDIMGSNRHLKFEGTACLMQGRGKMASVVVVVLTDVLFFLVETKDQKYAFFAPDNKAGVVSLQKLLVREKAGQESRGIYLISSNPAEPEMFELKIQKPKDKHLWIQAIRSAVEACPQDTDNPNSSELRDNRSSSISMLSVEERQRIAEAKQSHILSIVDELRKKDTEQALLLEERMGLQLRLLYTASFWSGNESESEKAEKADKALPNYTRLVRNEGIDSAQLWQEVVVAVQEATKLASSLSYTTGGATLSRSLSSAGERHSEAYVAPTLCVPRRAETFAGFDHNKERYPWRDSKIVNTIVPLPKIREVIPEEGIKEEVGPEINTDQQLAAIRLSHYVYTLLCIISNQMTTIDSLQAQLAVCKEGSTNTTKTSGSRPNPNRQLEELRNLQDQLSREKAAFRATTQQERTQLDEERAELSRRREQLAAEQRDVAQQRDQLFRRLEALERQGVSLLPPSTAGPAPVHISHAIQDTAQSRKTQAEGKRIPMNLISATNQQKVQSSLPPIKQQLPLKLASGSNNSNSRSNSASNNSPDRHSRTESSPATATSSIFSSSDFGNYQSHNSQTHPPNKSLRISRSPSHHQRHHQQQQQLAQLQQQQQHQHQHQQQQQQQQQQPPQEEEVIFF